MIETLHVAALVPTAALLIRGPRHLAAAYSLVALAFAVSWASDSLAWLLGGSWTAYYICLPIQVALVLVAITDQRRPWIVAGIAALAIASALISFPHPEILVTAVGSSAIVVFARGPLRAVLIPYFGIGSVLYMVMVSSGADFMFWWYPYQAARLLGFVAFAVLVFHEPKRRALWGTS